LLSFAALFSSSDFIDSAIYASGDEPIDSITYLICNDSGMVRASLGRDRQDKHLVRGFIVASGA
jgi:hypothetical protein